MSHVTAARGRAMAGRVQWMAARAMAARAMAARAMAARPMCDAYPTDGCTSDAARVMGVLYVCASTICCTLCIVRFWLVASAWVLD